MASQENTPQTKQSTIIKITGMYKEWFLDYASYVILERAVPALYDGFKPVQRRIMQSMKDLDDGRYNKVANLVGHTMQYHPHGDASIADAMVQIGQKDLLIDTQGNWGNILTGDGAAASRYIEARLSKFALEVLFNPKITLWQSSYDGRKKEPVHLPVKFPLLLVQGAEGIAVGLSTKIMPHNFNEVIAACIKHLQGKDFTLLPDFPTGGVADCTQYNQGKRGGRVRIRAQIEIRNPKTLIIHQIPYGTTTGSLIASVIKANEKGKIKIKHIEDNTASEVAILVHLPANVSAEKTVDALYAFTDCEKSIAPLCCVIENHKPLFSGVSHLLKASVAHTVTLLEKELNIQLEELENQWHFACLERIFIDNRIYRNIEQQDTWQGVLQAIEQGLKPHIQHLKRPVTREDIVHLTEIKIKKISKFDIDASNRLIQALEQKIKVIENNLANLVAYAIAYFKKLKQKYGKGKTRKTRLTVFQDIQANKVAIRNEKLYIDKREGFVGTALKNAEYVCDCSDIDDMIVFDGQGRMVVMKVPAKTFVSKDIIYIAIFKKQDKRKVYNMIYRDGITKESYAKRFVITGIIKNKVYDLTLGNKGSVVHYFSANPNGEAEKVVVTLKPVGMIKKLKWDLDFAKLAIKGRTSRGNLVTKLPVKKIDFKTAGSSTLQPFKMWFDGAASELNTQERGNFLGTFAAEDKLLVIYENGICKLLPPDIETHIDKGPLVLEKWRPENIVNVIYYQGEKERYYVKRFLVADPNQKELRFISEHPKSKLVFVTTAPTPVVKVLFSKRTTSPIRLDFESFMKVKGIKALGNQLSTEKIQKVSLLISKNKNTL